MTGLKIFPVIHHLDRVTTREQAWLAFDAGAHGVFLISHTGDDDALPVLGREIKQEFPDLQVGINFLGRGILAACQACVENDLDMAWGDACGISSAGLTPLGHQVSAFTQTHPAIKVFASVAFKYQPNEPDPALAARVAKAAGCIPTTSGSATGSAPTIDKVSAMSAAAGGMLAVASGMTPDNVQPFARHLSHILVATGVSTDAHHFDYELLRRFIGAACRGDYRHGQ